MYQSKIISFYLEILQFRLTRLYFDIIDKTYDSFYSYIIHSHIQYFKWTFTIGDQGCFNLFESFAFDQIQRQIQLLQSDVLLQCLGYERTPTDVDLVPLQVEMHECVIVLEVLRELLGTPDPEVAVGEVQMSQAVQDVQTFEWTLPGVVGGLQCFQLIFVWNWQGAHFKRC